MTSDVAALQLLESAEGIAVDTACVLTDWLCTFWTHPTA
jgi:hypothetical protein